MSEELRLVTEGESCLVFCSRKESSPDMVEEVSAKAEEKNGHVAHWGLASGLLSSDSAADKHSVLSHPCVLAWLLTVVPLAFLYSFHVSQSLHVAVDPFAAWGPTVDPILLSTEAATVPPTVAGGSLGVPGNHNNSALHKDANSSRGTSTGQITVDPAVEARANELLALWSGMYRLEDKLPPHAVAPPVGLTPSVSPWAPHLEECHLLGWHRMRWERHPEPAAYPEWACAEKDIRTGQLKKCTFPQPPWVQGADEDNLPLTRLAQRDIWVHQFPRNCSDPSLKFLVAAWFPMRYGIGSQLHVMSEALSLAMATNRILVPLNNYGRANHATCQRLGRKSSLGCYFFPITSPQCYERAVSEVYSNRSVSLDEADEWRPRLLQDLQSTQAQVVFTSVYHTRGRSDAANIWLREEPQDTPFAYMGNVSHNYRRYKLTWWRSQTTRFFLRWPTPYLCHLTNQARHATYGRHVALEWAKAESSQVKTELRIPEKEKKLWRTPSDFNVPVDRTPTWRLRSEPYLPRPIISMHVRQGDKSYEMKLFRFPIYMKLAYQIRKLDPSVVNIWLSTEMENIVNARNQYQDWSFYVTPGVRQKSLASMPSYELSRGVEGHVGSSFANLIIASQCDHFMGTLGSNWNRLINELRLTNGRAKASYWALNVDDM